MKQNKVLIVTLLVVVVGIWGTVFFKINEIRQGSDGLNNNPASIIKSDKIPSKMNHKSDLMLNYNDPFLKGKFLPRDDSPESSRGIGEINNHIDTHLERSSTKPEVNIEDVLKDIFYYGYMGSPELKKEVGFVRYKEKIFVIHEGDSIRKVYIKSITSDSLIFSYDKRTYIIKATQNKNVNK